MGFYSDPENSLFMTADGSTGVAVNFDGDLVSVYKTPRSKDPVLPFLEKAAQRSKTLDAYDINGFSPPLFDAEFIKNKIRLNKNSFKKKHGCFSPGSSDENPSHIKFDAVENLKSGTVLRRSGK